MPFMSGTDQMRVRGAIKCSAQFANKKNAGEDSR